MRAGERFWRKSPLRAMKKAANSDEFARRRRISMVRAPIPA
jgi:hypothetical protein